ncbi:hypothetical protein BDR06DRAFT_978250 [Suillus hirtellus]|nr:hypothetical protein BDR06DRAFT_978250 [Suillus hirtellus]
MQDDADPSTPYKNPILTGDIHVSQEHDEVSEDEYIAHNTDAPLSPPLKSRLREKKKANPTAITVTGQHKKAPSKPARPVVFASKGPLPMAKGRANITQKRLNKVTYTIDELLCESRTGTNSLTPSISSFLVDPEGQNFLRSTIESKHDSWLVIARHVASLLRHECVPRAMRSMASLLMSIEFWIKDISVECQEVLPNVTHDQVLPPLWN